MSAKGRPESSEGTLGLATRYPDSACAPYPIYTDCERWACQYRRGQRKALAKRDAVAHTTKKKKPCQHATGPAQKKQKRTEVRLKKKAAGSRESHRRLGWTLD